MQPINHLFKIAALAFLLLIAGFMAPFYLREVAVLGHNIPQPNMAQDYLTGLLWALALGGAILLWPVPSTHKTRLLLLWMAKVLVTLGFMLVYESHYELDATGYYALSASNTFVWHGFKLGNGTQNVVNIAWLFQHLIPDSYHAMKVSFAMVGLCAIYFFYRAIVIFLQRDHLTILMALGLFPSILFWSSILGKDPIVLLGISLYALGAAGLYQYRQMRYIFLLGAGVYLAMFIRVWLGPILLVPLIAFVLLGIRSPWAKIALLCLAATAFLVSLNQFMGQFDVETSQDLLATTDTVSKSWATGGSAQEIGPGFTNLTHMLAFMPKGAFAALFRPLPGEVMNAFGLLVSFENLFLLALLGLAVKRMKFADLKEPPVLWAIVLIFVWSMLYGFVSYQNLGTAVRFKLQILPVLLSVLLYLSRGRAGQQQV